MHDSNKTIGVSGDLSFDVHFYTSVFGKLRGNQIIEN